MLSGAPDRRLDLLAEGLRTAARMARAQAHSGLRADNATDHDLIRGQVLGGFADQLEAVAFRFEELADGTMSIPTLATHA